MTGLGLAGFVGGLATGSPMLTAASGYGLIMNGMNVLKTRKQLEYTNRTLLGNSGLKQAMTQITETGDAAVDRQLKSIQKMTEEMTTRYRGSL